MFENFTNDEQNVFTPFILVDFGPILAARWAQEGHQELQRPKKLHFQKSGFRVGLSAFFRSWGLPREPQEAQEGSQEAPKELQNPPKKESKIGPKN